MPVVVDVILEERYWYPDDGGVVWVAGYQPVDTMGRSSLATHPSWPPAGSGSRAWPAPRTTRTR